MNRIEKAIKLLEKRNLDAIYLTKESNVNYISGYTDEAAFALISKNGNFIITDSRFVELAENVCKNYEVINWHLFDRSIAKAITSVCLKVNLKNIGFEKNHIVFDEYNSIKNELDLENINFIPSEGIIEELRYVKSEEEIECTRMACKIADKALEELIPHIKIGVKENELAAKLEYFIRMQGAEIGFDTILISGSKSSLLHGKPSDKKLENGDLLIIDYGAKYKGYISDTTRTFIIGNASDKQIELYNLIKEAQQVGIDNMKSGAHATTPDAKIREIIKEYEEYYYRGIGHGVGRDLHEEPFIGNYGTRTMEEGCVITIEPGIYFPGWGGIRIEDTVLITKEGNEILTKFPKDLMILDKQEASVECN